MAEIVATFKIMPDSPDQDLAKIAEEAKAIITESKGEVGETEEEPIAFGLKAVKITMLRDESVGGTEDLEKALAAIEGVASVQIVAIGRTL
ncbi:MAG: elongation factor 1-beta [Candidatus Nanoarchaeia archaeon]